MNHFEQFVSTEGFFPVGESFSWRSDLLWAFLLSDFMMGLAFIGMALACWFAARKVRATKLGLNIIFPILLALVGAVHLVAAVLLWQPIFWVSALLKVATASVAALAVIWLVQIWPQILEIAQLAREVDAAYTRAERRSRRSLVSNRDFEELLKRSVFLPGILMLVLTVVFTSQITYIVNVKSEVSSATKRISQMHAVLRNFVDAESSFRGFLLSGEPRFLKPMDESKAKMPRLLNELLQKTQDDPTLHENLVRIANNYIEWIRVAHPLIERRAQGKSIINSKAIHRQQELVDSSRTIFAESIRIMVNQRDAYSENADQAAHLFILVSVSLGALVAVSLALWARKQILNLSDSYARALANSRELNAHLEERVKERTLALHEANEALANANNELEAFSYSVSHDLRGPLRGIGGFSQILTEEYGTRLDSEGRQYLEFIRNGVKKMGQLIDDLLNLSKLAKVDMQLKDVNVSTQAMDIAQALHQRDPSRSVQINIEPGLHVQGDPNLIGILLENLLINAWKFTAQTPHPLIQISKAHEGDWTGFRVRDNGAGFDMSYQDKLFQPFQRLHSNRDYEGTGIGLALCKRIVERHGGLIRANARPQEGAEFVVLLPERPVSPPSPVNRDASHSILT